MKKFLLICAILISQIAFTQENNKIIYPQDVDKKSELKLNVFNLIVLSSIDVTYEHLLNKDSSMGITLFYNFNEIDNNVYYPRKFSLTPYYRWFFSETRYARGFFVEGFGMLNTFEDEFFTGNSTPEIKTETDFALGVSVGGKFVTKSGFTAEVFLGVGRNFFNNDDDFFFDNEIITRGGITLGYRF